MTHYKVYILGLLVALSCLVAGCSSGGAGVPKRVLVVHAYKANYAPYGGYNEEMVKGLQQKGIEPDVRFIYLDCESYREVEEIAVLEVLLDETCRTWRPDVIVVNEDQATYSLLMGNHSLVRSVPIVFGGVNFPNWELLARYNNVTGFHDELAVWENVQLMQELFKGRYQPYTLLDSTYLDRKLRETVAQQLEPHPVTGFFRKDTEQQKRALVEQGYIDFKSYSLRLLGGGKESPFAIMRSENQRQGYIQLKRDVTTERVGLLNVNPCLTAMAEGFDNDEQLLGGYFTPLTLQLEEQVDYVARILKGESLANLPVMKSGKRYVMDWRVWRELGYSYTQIPRKFEVVNLPPHLAHPVLYYGKCVVIIGGVLLLIVLLSVRLRIERKRKRKALQELASEKETLALAIRGGGTFAWRIENNKFLIDSTFWEAIHAHERRLTLSEFVSFVHPDFRKQALHELSNLSASANQVLQVPCAFDGGKLYRWWEFRFTSVRQVGGRRTLGLLLDVEQEKQREQEMQLAREMAEKSELKQSFLTNISHEIRTPLNAIVGFTNILYSGEEIEPEERELCVDSINRNTELLLGLVNDVLDLSRFESGHMEVKLSKCGIAELMEEIRHTYQVLMPDHLDFEFENVEVAAFVNVDKGRFTQVLSNFLTNAIKFTEGGYVKLGCKLDAKRHQAIFFVEDTGKGIPLEEQKMIFSRFYKQDEFAQGTGLGLSICQAIIEKLNGELELWSEPGKGSRFSVKLPYWRILSSAELLH
ncbi:MAG: ATP-binding protein [Phocaeicola sp.]